MQLQVLGFSVGSQEVEKTLQLEKGLFKMVEKQPQKTKHNFILYEYMYSTKIGKQQFIIFAVSHNIRM